MTGRDPGLHSAGDGADAELQEAVTLVLAALAVGDLRAAQGTYSGHLVRYPTAVRATRERDLVRALRAATTPPAGTIHVGPGALVFGNPYRSDWAWRCSCCPRPCASSNHAAAALASAEADMHAQDLRSDGQSVTITNGTTRGAAEAAIPITSEGPGGSIHIHEDVRQGPDQNPTGD